MYSGIIWCFLEYLGEYIKWYIKEVITISNLYNTLIQRQQELEAIIKKIPPIEKNKQEKWLRISKCRGYEQYYCTDKNSKSEIYIPKDNISFIKALAQTSYNQLLVKSTQRNWLVMILNINMSVLYI